MEMERRRSSGTQPEKIKPDLNNEGYDGYDLFKRRGGIVITLGAMFLRSDYRKRIQSLNESLRFPSSATYLPKHSKNKLLRHHGKRKVVKFPPVVRPKTCRSRQKLVYPKAEQPLERFRRVSRLVQLLCGICRHLDNCRKLRQAKQDLSLTEMYLNMSDDFNQFLDFNSTIYHSRIIMQKGGSRLKNVLNIPPNERTNEHVQIILALLRENDSFQDYPYHTQIDLCGCVHYQRYEARRVVLREGHAAVASYIILSGTVLVNKRELDPRSGQTFVRTLHELSDGEAFGESALINDTVRTTTVVCKTDVELLVTMKEDFDRIIKEPLQQQREKHIEYCRSLPLFKDFPCETFETSPANFFYQYYKKEKMVVPDSRESEFLVVIKTGTCRVICEAREQTVGRRHSSRLQAELERAFPLYTERMRLRRKSANQTTGGGRVSDEFTDRVRADVISGLTDAATLFHQTEQKSLLDERDDNSLFGNKGKMSEPREWVSHQAARERSSSDTSTTGCSSGYSRTPSRPKTAAPTSVPTSKSSLDENQGRVRFAQIAQLKSGAVFGLESLFQRFPTRLILLSEGAECILVSKKLFVNHLNPKVLKVISEIVVNYPTDSYVLRRVQENRQWAQYKQAIVRDVVRKNDRIRPRTAPPSGRYSRVSRAQ